MSKEITYRKASRERLKELLERIGYKVTNQSTSGSHKLIRLPDGTSTGYWLMNDRVEHKLDNFRGGSDFHYKECVFKFSGDTVNVVAKNSPSIYLSFHNFKSHESPQEVKE
jgi:hypothetical protein